MPRPENKIRIPTAGSIRTAARMKRRTFASAVFAASLLLPPHCTQAQAPNAPATPPAASQDSDQRGRILLDKMIDALGGSAWLNRTSMQADGRGSSFFRGEPNPYTSEFHELHRFAASGAPAALRLGFLTDRGMIMPGKKIDVVQIWKEGHGYEVTFKGQVELPKDQVADFYRRENHSLEEVVRTWIHAPGVMILREGTSMVERRLADKLTVLTANNDAVTFELDAATHLPLRRTFQWRNPQFNDLDEEVETYDDYHTFQGILTPLTLTRYRNGDMTSQHFLSHISYNIPAPPALFDPAVLLHKK
jgi:hypothetical protein